MKKMLLHTIVGAAALALAMPGTGWAAVAGTPHDVTTTAPTKTTFGVCSACHIPHKAYGARLWPTDQSGAPAARGTVGSLCTYCHGVGAGIVAAAETPYPWKDIAASANTHGLIKANFPDVAASLSGSGLPYTATPAANMECTSCHNVHDNATNTQPFLQVVPGNAAQNIDTICSGCHSDRQFVNGVAAKTVGTWGDHYGNDLTPGHAAGGNPGSHPVGTDVFGDTSQHPVTTPATPEPDSVIATTSIGLGGVLDYYATTKWQIGPHLISGGTSWASPNGIGCVTCHATHGIDNSGHTSQQYANADLLVNAQGSQGSAANGNGSPNNALCEACHRGVVPGFTSTYFPNPGTVGRFTHPVDDYPGSGLDTGVTAVGWTAPTGSLAVNNPSIICESCHIPHARSLSVSTLHTDTIQAAWNGSNSHILRAPDNVVCAGCHTTTIVDHHPVGNGYLSARMQDANLQATSDTNLTCGTCHQGSGAHNWLSSGGVGLKGTWRPFDNGRSGATACTPAQRFTPDMSVECTVCHTASGSHFSPTGPTGSAPAVGKGNANYQNAGDGSHFLGSRSGGYAAAVGGWPQGGAALSTDGTQAGNGSTFVTRTWDMAPGNTVNGWSCLGGTGTGDGQLVCESCHNLDPRKNYPGTRLLLWNYTENLTESRSAFCEGCHSPGGTALGNPHPMTNDTISRAVTAARATTTLVTGTGTSYADKGATGETTYPAADQMNCDSCHQPHDTVDTTGTYILENTTGGTTGAITGAPVGSVVVGTGTVITFTNVKFSGGEAAAARLNYQPFCNLCHSSGQ